MQTFFIDAHAKLVTERCSSLASKNVASAGRSHVASAASVVAAAAAEVVVSSSTSAAAPCMKLREAVKGWVHEGRLGMVSVFDSAPPFSPQL